MSKKNVSEYFKLFRTIRKFLYIITITIFEENIICITIVANLLTYQFLIQVRLCLLYISYS